jgi:uncharacterized repeat protein (TIGR01451 family)/LPXTG-motif cell wall-anchored protein
MKKLSAKFARLFSSLPKRLFAGALVALAFALPVATSAASTVSIEGSMGVANVTNGDTKYASSVNATYNQVVKLQVYYHNRELPDSGKVAQNLRVKINIPSTPGKTQTQTATISADNSNTVTDKTTVNLDRSDAYLQYIPGSAVWRHNVGTNDNVKEVNTTISDAVVTSGTGLVLENEKPCYNFSATVTVMARVMVPGVKVVKQSQVHGQTNKWSNDNTANPGDTMDYIITYQNTGNTTQKNVLIRDNLPLHMSLVPGSTKLYANIAGYENGKAVGTDNITSGGIVIGNYPAGTGAYVTFRATIDPASKLECGTSTFRNVGVAQPEGYNQYYNIAVTSVTKKCETPTPVYSCNLLTLSQTDNRTVKASVDYTAKSGATYKSTSINWGDGTTNGSTSHTYAKDGTYTVTAKVTFNVNGTTKTVSGPKCTKQITVKTPAKPVYACDLLTLSKDGHTVTASVTYTAAGGATLKTVAYSWGDSNQPLITDKTTAQHTYTSDGNFTVTAKLLFSVNGKDVFVSGDKCAQPVSFTTPTPPVTPPTELPNTGAGNVIGIFAGAVAVGAFGYRLFLGRRLTRQ